MRVLVCDDHPVIVDAVTVCMHRIDPECRVDHVGTLRQASEQIARTGRYDLVILDLGLPDAQGTEAVIRLRAAHPDANVVVFSASEDRRSVLGVIDAGASGFIPKSADRAMLLRGLERVLGGMTYVPEAVSGKSLGDGGAYAALPVGDAVRDAVAALTPRQSQVLRLLLRGLPNKAICRELGLSENTIKVHISQVLRALRVRNRTEAVVAASRIGYPLD
jgi:DNA-binding NarL/FixJ family response regulator